MSHFYGTLQGNRGEATRCGSKNSGIETWAAGWGGAIRTSVWHDERDDVDRFRVYMTPWQGSGDRHCIAEGILGRRDELKVYPPSGSPD